MLSSSPLIVAPSSSSSPSSSTSPHSAASTHTCRVIIGPTDDDFISVIIHRATTVGQLKLEAVKAILARDASASSFAASVPLPDPSLLSDQWMVVKRINPRAQSTYPSSLPFLPQMNTGLLHNASPFPTLIPSHIQAGAAYPLPLSSTSFMAQLGSTTRPAPPTRVAPKAPGSVSPTSPASPPSGSTAKAAVAPSVSFPLSMFGGGSLMRLDDAELVYGVHDDAVYDLMVERVTDDVHIRLSLDDEARQTRSPSALPPLPSPSPDDPHTLPDTRSASASASYPLSLPLPPHPSLSPLIATERSTDLTPGLDVCVMSIHGTYLQSPAARQLRVSCLDRHTTFTLLDSALVDAATGTGYKYLRSESGEYLTADEGGQLYLDDLIPTEEGSEDCGVLRAKHRWIVKRGLCQSFISAHGQFLTITEEGEILLTPIRYEESCVHICFAVIQGSLRKKTDGGIRGFRRWIPKFFVLSGSTLTYFDQEEDIYDRDNNPALKKGGGAGQGQGGGAKDTSSVYSTAGILSINVYPAPSTRFDVEFVNGRVLQVKAGGQAERDRWVGALRNGKVGKAMDQKAKAGKKKKERENTLLAREKERVRQAKMDEEQKEQSTLPPDTSTTHSLFVNPSSKARPGGANAAAPQSIAEEPNNMQFTVLVEGVGGNAKTNTMGVTGGVHHAGTPSVSVTPDLSLYQSRPQSPGSGAATPSGTPSGGLAHSRQTSESPGPTTGRRRSLSM